MIPHSGMAYCCLSHDVLIPEVPALLQFRVAALINDSVGTLAGGCYVDADTKIGVILGTGTNACYVEEARNISSLAGKNGQGQQRPLMAINTEWGNFDASSLPSTDVSPTRSLPCIDCPSSQGSQMSEPGLTRHPPMHVTEDCAHIHPWRLDYELLCRLLKSLKALLKAWHPKGKDSVVTDATTLHPASWVLDSGALAATHRRVLPAD